MTPPARVAWHRAGSFAAAVALVAGARFGIPDPGERSELLYIGVLSLGYGHLLGPVLSTRPRITVLLGLAAAFCGYTGLVHRVPEAVVLLLGLAVWHTVENDLALSESAAVRSGRQLVVLGVTALLGSVFAGAGAADVLGLALPGALLEEALRAAALGLALGAAIGWPEQRRAAALLACATAVLPAGGLGLSFPEAFALATLYHLLSWGWLRVRCSGAGPVLALHGVPGLLAAALVALPGEPAAAARSFVFSPVVYLFWSGAHVVQTTLARKRSG